MTEDLRDWIDQQDCVMGAFQRCVHGYRELARNRRAHGHPLAIDADRLADATVEKMNRWAASHALEKPKR